MRRRALLLALLLFACVACADYDGENDGFVVTGKIAKITDNSVILEDPITIEEHHGDAVDYLASGGGWFDNNHREFHDNYNGDLGRKYVGAEYDSNNVEIQLTDLKVGQYVRLRGRIRDSNVGDSTEQRAVYDRLEIVLQ